jgi:hypothetical protein
MTASLRPSSARFAQRGVLAALGVVAACAAAPADPDAVRRDRVREALALADPAFGGGAVLEQRLFAWPGHIASGEPRARSEFVAAARARVDADALVLVRELVDDALADAIADYVTSTAAAATWAAETRALALHRWQSDGFFAEAAALFADPERCGIGASARLAELNAAIAVGSVSVSPARAALQVAALGVHAEHCPQIAAFHATPAGAAWLALRAAAFARSEPRFGAVSAAAHEHGFVTKGFVAGDLSDLELPRARFAEDTRPASVLTFEVDPAGGLRCGDERLPNLARPDEVLAALRALRVGRIADGTLHLQRLPNDPFATVAEPVLIRAPKGTPWPHVSTLMKLFADETVAFWKVELATDPPTNSPAAGRER